MKQKTLAALLGVSPAQVSKLGKRGMPLDDLAAARRWRDENLDPLRMRDIETPPPADLRALQESIEYLECFGRSSTAMIELLKADIIAARESLFRLGESELRLALDAMEDRATQAADESITWPDHVLARQR